jgi:hypothetical protein
MSFWRGRFSDHVSCTEHVTGKAMVAEATTPKDH